MRRVFITGHTGHIGRVLTEKLKARKWEVVGYSRRYGDNILYPDRLAEKMDGSSRVIHLAGIVSFDPSKREYLQKVNVEGTARVLETACKVSVGKVIIVSTALTCGWTFNPESVLNESCQAGPDYFKNNPYLETKLQAEQLINHYPVSSVVVAPSNCRFDYFVDYVEGKKAVVVPPGGLNMIGVDDLCEGIIAALNKGRAGEKYLLSDQNMTYSEFFDMIARYGYKAPLLIQLPRCTRHLAMVFSSFQRNEMVSPSVVESAYGYKYYDNSKVARDLQWRPQDPMFNSIIDAIRRRYETADV